MRRSGVSTIEAYCCRPSHIYLSRQTNNGLALVISDLSVWGIRQRNNNAIVAHHIAMTNKGKFENKWTGLRANDGQQPKFRTMGLLYCPKGAEQRESAQRQGNVGMAYRYKYTMAPLVGEPQNRRHSKQTQCGSTDHYGTQLLEWNWNSSSGTFVHKTDVGTCTNLPFARSFANT